METEIEMQESSFQDEDFQSVLSQIQANHQKKSKQTVIVIGPKGVGKSTFIKELVPEQLRNQVRTSAEANSCTTECNLYPLGLKAKTRMNIPQEEQIYMMDTPGINTQLECYIAISAIKLKICQEHCDIIGIAYLKQASETRLHRETLLFNEIFPVAKEIKQTISFMIFSKFDEKCFYSQQFEKSKRSLIKKFVQKQINFVQERNLKWMSHSEMPQILDHLIQDYPIFEQSQTNQWRDFSLMLANRNSHRCSFARFEKDYQRFEEVFKSKIFMSLQNLQEVKSDLIKFKLTTKKQNKTHYVFAGSGITCLKSSLGIIGASTVARSFIMAPLLATGIIAVPILSLATIGVFLMSTAYAISIKRRQRRTQRVVKALENLNKTLQTQRQENYHNPVEQFYHTIQDEIKKFYMEKMNWRSASQGVLKFDMSKRIKKLKVKGRSNSHKEIQERHEYFLDQKKLKTQISYSRDIKLESNRTYKFYIETQIPTRQQILKQMHLALKQIYA